MPSNLSWLLPWEFSPTLLISCLLAIGLFVRGIRSSGAAGFPHRAWRSVEFFTGLVLVYAVMQTHFDYLAQHMFWIHRTQHLVLHHLGPFLICLAAPWEIMGLGLPRKLYARVLMPLWHHTIVRQVYRGIQHPLVASVLFIGLIFYWLTPSVHFLAMLDARRYWLMNWSMLLDGLLFWWLILDPRPREAGARTGFGPRMLVMWVIMPPQIAIGAWISLSSSDIYTVYAVCGRIWPINPITDQHIGGLITWIPACMMSVIAALILLHRWTHQSDACRLVLAGAAGVARG